MVKRILKFSATWCSPCQSLKRTLAGMDINDKVEEIDIEENEDLCEKYKIKNIPVLVFLDENDNEIDRLVGNVPKNTIEEKINILEKEA